MPVARLNCSSAVVSSWGAMSRSTRPTAWIGLVDLDIAPQELTTALEQFSRATGMAVLVDHQLSSQRQTLGVQGRFTPSEGLRVLLSGTGLAAHYARADAFTLQPVRVREVPLPPGVTPSSVSYTHLTLPTICSV